jgi:hypothetical protein
MLNGTFSRKISLPEQHYPDELVEYRKFFNRRRYFTGVSAISGVEKDDDRLSDRSNEKDIEPGLILFYLIVYKISLR